MDRFFRTHPLVVDKNLAKILGLNEALVLQQINYWLEINKKKNNNFHNDRYWTYNSLTQWQEEFPFWSKETVKRIFKRLREKKLLITGSFNKKKFDRTLWYSIDYDELEKLFEYGNADNVTKSKNETCSDGPGQNEHMDEGNLNPPIPEISTEINPENKNQSINPSRRSRQKDRRYNSFGISEKYEKIISKCYLDDIEDTYRVSVSHCIELLILDIEKGDRVKIGNKYIPAKIVDRDLSKLDHFTVVHGINKFKKASREFEIRNTVGYLKACIYNAIYERQLDVDTKLRYRGII